MPGKASTKAKKLFGSRTKVYEALKGSGLSKSSAVAITNAGKTRAGRSRMARKAAATRKRG